MQNPGLQYFSVLVSIVQHCSALARSGPGRSGFPRACLIFQYLSVSSSIFQYLSGSFLIATSHSGFPNPSLSFSTFQYFAVSFSTVLVRSWSLPAVLAFPIFPYFSVPCSICQTFPYLSILTHTFLDHSFPPWLFPVLLRIPNYS